VVQELRAFDPSVVVEGIHGQMDEEERDGILKRFAAGKVHILVATTVIEVGVNVPEANIMAIDQPDRFGRAQLHQLRGRVGRGDVQAWCFLMLPEDASADNTLDRLTQFSHTDDGFEIAEVDLELRGPGETGGTRQSGQIEMLIGDLQKDGALIPQVREAAIKLLSDDPKLIKPENRMLREHYKELFAQTFDWSQIG
jgi:ATP-dependent DNA helicase RecG